MMAQSEMLDLPFSAEVIDAVLMDLIKGDRWIFPVGELEGRSRVVAVWLEERIEPWRIGEDAEGPLPPFLWKVIGKHYFHYWDGNLWCHYWNWAPHAVIPRKEQGS